MSDYWEEQQLKQMGMSSMIAKSETKPDPKFGEPALEETLNNVKKTLWDVERHTHDTQSRLDKSNKSGPSRPLYKIAKWSDNNWILDMISETLVEMQHTLETSSIARHSKSPLETSLAKLQDSTVSFNEKTMRWHDDQTNLMVKGSDPRVAKAMKPEPSAVEKATEDKTEDKMVTTKKTGLGVLAGFLKQIVEEHKKTRKLLGQGFFGKKSRGKSAEQKDEAATDAEQGAENEEKQTSFLSRLWENSKESKKDSWLADNWGKLLIGIGLLLTPLKHVVKLWDWIKEAAIWSVENPGWAAMLALSTWFFGGTFVKMIVSAIGSALTSGAFWGGVGKAIGGAAKFLKAFAVGGLASPLAIVGALFAALFDGIMGYFKSAEWGTSKIGGFLGGMFAGGKGWIGMFTNMGKWAVFGATLGAPFFGVGAIPGGLIGAAIGAIFNLIGGKRMAQAWDNLGGIFKKLFGPLWDGLKLFASDMFEWIIMKPVRWIKEKFMGSSFLDDFAKGWAEMKLQLKSVYDSVVQPFIDLFNWIIDPENVITWDLVKDTFSKILAKLQSIIAAPIKALKEFFFGGEAEAAVPEGQVTATSTVAKTKDEKARVKSNLATLDKLQEEGGVLGMRDKGVDSKTQEAIEGIDTDDLRMAVFEAKHVGLDKKDPALVKAMTEELEKRTMAKDDTEATIMTKGEWTASDEFKKTFLNPETGKIEGASTAVQEMEYTKYVEGKRGTAGVDLSSETAEQIPSTNVGLSRKATQVTKKLISEYDKHNAKGSRTKGMRWGTRQRMSASLKSASPKIRAAMIKELKGTALGDKMKAQFGDDFIAPDLREVKGAEGMATETGGLDMLSPAFQARVAPDEKMNTFNSIQKENLAAQNQPSSPVVMTAVDQSKTVAPFEQNLMMEDKLHNSDIPVGVNQ